EAVRELSYELFHNYKQISDTEIKVQLKNKLENNKDCAEHLHLLEEKGFSFNRL
ncbi:23720_t:CDS:1, partial [Racocetra persica]